MRLIDSTSALPAIFAAKCAVVVVVANPGEHPSNDCADALPSDLASAHALILAQRELLAAAQSEAKTRALEIERLKLQLAKARHERFGQSSERGKLLVEQLELAIVDLEETQSEEETRAELAAVDAAKAPPRRRSQRGPRKLPEDLPVERVVEPAPCVCGKCGGARLRKLGEVVSKTLECEPRRWKIVAHVREKFACRDCDGVTEPPAPSHPIPRGFAGPSLLAMILVGKYGDHLPLNRQAAAFAREGIELDDSTLADWVGGCAAALTPVIEELRRHVLAAERLHVDDTTVPVLAKVKTRTGRIWTYVRDDRPFGGTDPPAVLYDYSPSRHGEYPRKVLVAWSGVMQADAFPGYNALYLANRKPAPILEAACWAHGRREFFDLAKLGKAPIAAEIVRRIDEVFAIEREITGKSPEQRRVARQQRSKPLVEALEVYMREQLDRLSTKIETAKAIRYMTTRWTAFTRFLDDGRICMSNNAAERAMRCVAVGRRNWTFAGSDAGGHRAAAIYSLIMTCKLNDVDPRAWLADVLARLPDHPVRRIGELMPWVWAATKITPAKSDAAAAA